MQKVIVDIKDFQTVITLNKEQANHYLKVLRMKNKDKLIVVCNNKKYLYEVSSIKPFQISLVNEIEDDTINPFNINVYFAIIKAKHLEIAIQKAAELNVNTFNLYYFDYSQKNEKINLNRLQQIMVNACQQANRSSLMEIKVINHPDELKDSLMQNDINLIAHFDKDAKYISNTLKDTHHNIGLLIGPEGGFSDKDLSVMNNTNSCIISLTKSILRAETALIYAISVISETKLKE